MEFSSRRLHFRLLEESDREAFVALYQDPKIMRKIGPALSQDEAHSLFNAAFKLNGDTYFKQLMWRVCEKESGDDCGFVMLKAKGPEKCEIGLILIRRKNGKGFSLEALSKTCEFAFNNLRQSHVVAFFSINHKVIKKQLLQLGFVLDMQNREGNEQIIKASVDVNDLVIA